MHTVYRKHINRITGEMYNSLRNKIVTFAHRDEDMIRKLIRVHPKLEYAAVMWSLPMKKHIQKIERIQKTATTSLKKRKNIIAMGDFSYCREIW